MKGSLGYLWILTIAHKKGTLIAVSVLRNECNLVNDGFKMVLSPLIFQVAVETQLFLECLVGVEPQQAVQTVLSPPPTLPS